MRKLPNDYARCSNDKCENRKTCLRFMDIPTSQYYSLTKFNDENCKMYIKKTNPLLS